MRPCWSSCKWHHVTLHGHHHGQSQPIFYFFFILFNFVFRFYEVPQFALSFCLLQSPLQNAAAGLPSAAPPPQTGRVGSDLAFQVGFRSRVRIMAILPPCLDTTLSPTSG